MNPIQIQNTLLEKNLFVFSPLEFERVFKSKGRSTMHYLESGIKYGLFSRPKKGLYALKPFLPSETVLANRLYQPSYISFEYALAYYNMLPEMVYQVTSATTKPTRLFVFEDRGYSYLTIKEEAYTGYVFKSTADGGYYIAEPEKAFVDYMYFVSLKRKTHNDRILTSSLDREKVFSYAAYFNRPSLDRLIKENL